MPRTLPAYAELKGGIAIRIDRLIASTGIASRTEIAKAAAAGKITVDGVVTTRPNLHVEPERAVIVYCGETVVYRQYTSLMLNKPQGFVCSTDEPGEHTVLELLPERMRRLGLFPCGRLDKDTFGLVIMTNNGQLAHRMLSPRHHVEKVYLFRAEKPLAEEDAARLESGVTLDDGYLTKPAKLSAVSPDEWHITLTEGKYHQIKRMLAAVGNHVTYLERVEFAGIPLDNTLARGEWRLLTDEEADTLARNSIL